MEAIWNAKYEALPEDEKMRLKKEFSDPSLDRFIEDPLGGEEDD